jgi:hypothetical protein
MCFIICKITSELKRAILTTIYLVGAKKTPTYYYLKVKNNSFYQYPYVLPLFYMAKIRVTLQFLFKKERTSNFSLDEAYAKNYNIVYENNKILVGNPMHSCEILK